MNGLVNIQSKLLNAFKLLNPDTLQHAADISSERITQKELRKIWFWLADHTLWTIENQELVFYLGTRETNPVFKNIEKATKDLINTHKYSPPDADVEAIIAADSTLNISYSTLRLSVDEVVETKYPKEFIYFEFEPANPDLNEEEMKIVLRAYGRNGQFVSVMELFQRDCKLNPRVYLLAHDYAYSQIKKYGPVSRVSRLTGIRQGSQFLAAVRCVNEGDEPTRKFFLRGSYL